MYREQPITLFEMATQMLFARMGKPFAPAMETIGLLSTPRGQQEHAVVMAELKSAISAVQVWRTAS